MPDSPASATPYEVLGVPPTASQEELKRAYRKALRQSHPDVGGESARFHAVQRAWARVGDPVARADYDRGAGSRSATVPKTERRKAHDSALRARLYGHPGGAAREEFLTLMREWTGRGVEADPYDPALVQSAPREIRRRLAAALAQEATAKALAKLGIGYTVWSDVAAGDGKIDHVVLGPAGLFAVTSADWGGGVRLRRGELTGDTLGAAQPIKELSRSARALGRQLGVKFTGLLVVVPDDDLEEAVSVVGRKADAAVIRRSVLPMVVRDGIAGGTRRSIEDAFELRTRLQHGIRFV